MLDKIANISGRTRDLATRFFEILLIVFMAALVLDVLWGVISRYLIGSQARWSEEIARALMIQVALIGTAVAFSRKAHLGVDYFTGLMVPGARKVMAAVSHLTVMSFGGVLIWGGVPLAQNTFALNQSMTSIGLQKGWVYVCVPLSGTLIVVIALDGLAGVVSGREEY